MLLSPNTPRWAKLCSAGAAALMAVAAMGLAATRLSEGNSWHASLLRQPLAHLRAIAGVRNPSPVVALVDPEPSVLLEPVVVPRVLLARSKPSCRMDRRTRQSIRVRTQQFELSVSGAAQRWLERALRPLWADDAANG